MTSFKMLLFLFFLHLIKYSQKNVSMPHYDCIFFLFPYISSEFSFMYPFFYVVKVPNGLWCLSSLWIVPFIIKNIPSLKKNWNIVALKKKNILNDCKCSKQEEWITFYVLHWQGCFLYIKEINMETLFKLLSK